jgi:hypothetical protein
MSGRPLSYAFALVWTFAATLVSILAVKALTAVRGQPVTDIVTLGGVIAVTLIGASIIVLRIYTPERRGREAFALRPTHPALAALSLGLGLALYVPVSSVQGVVERLYPAPAEELAARAIMLNADSAARAVAIVLVAGCLLPLVEELFYRGALFGALRRTHSGPASAVVVAVCYVLGNVDLRGWPSALIVGMAASHLRLHSGSLLAPLAFNVGLSAVRIAAILEGVASVSRPIAAPWSIQLGCWALAVALLVAVQRLAGRSEQAERARSEDSDEP